MVDFLHVGMPKAASTFLEAEFRRDTHELQQLVGADFGQYGYLTHGAHEENGP